MKLFKNPVFAFFLCLLILASSTLINAKIGLEEKNARIGEQLCREVLEFAGENGIESLRSEARTAIVDGNYRSLIASFSETVEGHGEYEDLDDVEEAIVRYSRFLRSTEKYPAKTFVKLLNLSF